MVSGETLTKFLSTKGYYVPEQWDVYWANRQVRFTPAAHHITSRMSRVAMLMYVRCTGMGCQPLPLRSCPVCLA